MSKKIYSGLNIYALSGDTSGIRVVGSSTGSTYTIQAVNSALTETFSVLDNVSVNIGGGNGTNSTLSIRQHDYTIGNNILDIYGYNQAKHLMYISDNGTDTGTISMNGGDWQCDTYAGKYSIGTSTGGMKLGIKHNAVGDILAVAPVGGNGAFYVSAGVDNHPFIYLQDSAGTTTNLIFRSNGDSYINNGGNFGIGKPNPTATLDVCGAGDTSGTIGLSVTNSASTSMLLVRDDGNVGIGTSSPTATLDISGSTGYNQLRVRTSYTPSSSGDTNGNIGDIAWDNTYIYTKTNTGWGRALLDYAF